MSGKGSTGLGHSVAGSKAAQQGFTLLELLITLTILAAMAAMLFGSFRMSVKAWNRGDQVVAGVQRFRIMAELMRRQFSCAYALDIKKADQVAPGDLDGRERLQARGRMLPAAGAAFPGLGPSSRMGGSPLFKGTPSGLQFTGLYPLRPFENMGMNLITYSLDRDPEGSGYRLVERESRFLGSDSIREFDSFFAQDRFNVVFDGLEQATFQYYGVDPLTGAAGWEDSWDSNEKDGLPKAISLDITLIEDVGKMGRKHRFVTPVISEPFRSRIREGVQGLFQSSSPIRTQ